MYIFHFPDSEMKMTVSEKHIKLPLSFELSVQEEEFCENISMGKFMPNEMLLCHLMEFWHNKKHSRQFL